MGILKPAQPEEALRPFTATSARFAATEDALWLASRLKVSLSDDDQVILATAAAGNSGVSVIAAETALALALMNLGHVLLVDANPYGESRDEAPMYAHFEAPAGPGLAELLSGSIDIEKGIVKTGLPTLDVLPLGEPDDELVGLLLSESSTRLFQALRERYRLILVDAPPLMEYPETAVFAPRSDGVLLVIPAGSINRSRVVSVKQMIDGLNVPILGTVLCDRTGRLKV
jgi:Mrp family chromosome partitioning ATPase